MKDDGTQVIKSARRALLVHAAAGLAAFGIGLWGFAPGAGDPPAGAAFVFGLALFGLLLAGWLALEASPWLVAKSPWVILGSTALLGPLVGLGCWAMARAMPWARTGPWPWVLAALAVVLPAAHALLTRSAPRRVASVGFAVLVATLAVGASLGAVLVAEGHVEASGPAAGRLVVALSVGLAAVLVPFLARTRSLPPAVFSLAAAFGLTALAADAFSRLAERLSANDWLRAGGLCAILAFGLFVATLLSAAWARGVILPPAAPLTR